MPEGAVYVGRPTKWGNRWYIQKRVVPSPFGLDWLTIGPGIQDAFPTRYEAAARAVELFRDALHYGRFNWQDEHFAREQLRGRDLACWCPLDQPCHADILLEIANAS